jgi:hypothetical protein
MREGYIPEIFLITGANLNGSCKQVSKCTHSDTVVESSPGFGLRLLQMAPVTLEKRKRNNGLRNKRICSYVCKTP